MGFFDNFPWTNFHELNLDWIIRTIKAIKVSLDKLWKEFLLSRVPTGGDEGDVLTKTDVKDYAMAWKKPVSKNGLPAGGKDGQYLKKTGVADYSASWADLPASRNVPTGGVRGNVLTKTGAGADDYNWQEPAASHDIPAGGTTGQVLKKSSDEDYATEWGEGGGGLPEGGTDGQIIKQVDGQAQWADAPLGVPATGEAGTFLKRTGPEAESYGFVKGWLPEEGPTNADLVLKSTGAGTAVWGLQAGVTGAIGAGTLHMLDAMPTEFKELKSDDGKSVRQWLRDIIGPSMPISGGIFRLDVSGMAADNKIYNGYCLIDPIRRPNTEIPIIGYNNTGAAAVIGFVKTNSGGDNFFIKGGDKPFAFNLGFNLYTFSVYAEVDNSGKFV